MSAPRHVIGVPWDAPVFQRYNAQHPLPRSLIEDTPEFEFRHELAAPTAERKALVQRALVDWRDGLRVAAPNIPQDALVEFISSRDLDSQYAMSGSVDLNFLHTAPMTFGQRPWAMHIEATLPMFEPFFGHFRTWDIDLEATPGWHFVRQLVNAPACRAIFTHLRRTQEDLPRLFRNPALAGKVHYAPLGIELPPEFSKPAQDAIARKNAKGDGDEIVMLFTNSWHQAPDSFIKRGGLEVLFAFLVIQQRRPNCRLIIRSSLSDRVRQTVPEHVFQHPQIEILDQMITDEQLYDLYLRADVFLLPSTNLHTISMLRAMQTGALLITSDVSSVDEFVTHEETGLIMPGWRGVSYREDLEQGLLREQMAARREINNVLTTNLAMTIERVIAERDFRNRLRMNAQRHVTINHAMGPWRDGFHHMLRACLEGSPERSAVGS
jgi:glycosyltransferase involved in cell wall biosynthesis